MTWVTQTRPHTCKLPRNPMFGKAKFGRGSVWQCDECDQKYRLVSRKQGDQWQYT